MTEERKMKLRIVIRAPIGMSESLLSAPDADGLDAPGVPRTQKPERRNLGVFAAVLTAVTLAACGWYLWPSQVAPTPTNLSARPSAAAAADIATLEPIVESSGAAVPSKGIAKVDQSRELAAMGTSETADTALAGASGPTMHGTDNRASSNPQASSVRADERVPPDTSAPPTSRPEPETTISSTIPQSQKDLGGESSTGEIAAAGVSATEPVVRIDESDMENAAGNIDIAAKAGNPHLPGSPSGSRSDQAIPALAAVSAPDSGSQQAAGLDRIASGNLARAVLSWGVYRREPTAEAGATVSVPGPGSVKIYFFTEIQGLSGQSVTHRWLYEGRTIATVPFRIGGDRWRVHSTKNLTPGTTGTWEVVVEDSNGTPLGRRQFRVTAGKSSG